ncbi:MAG: hypothetical protein HY942_08035 [Gammaproteobacteria bacterium]|nr:hypothetical protein [Gammaproteobacteria bacterium]
MIVEETFYRPDEVAREARTLPAATYNLARRLLGGGACVFVPIRGMQVLAVLDAEEFIFVDREGGRSIDIAWQRFRPGERTALAEPVPYEAVYYSATAAQTMPRLQSEFQKALAQLADRATAQVTAQVVKLPMRQR